MNASEARWSPDGRRVAYIAGGQLWVADADGANRVQLTKLSGATGPIWAPNGSLVAFTSSVYPDCNSDACNAARDSAAAVNPVRAHIADQLMYRHWTAWDNGTRSHLFVVAANGSGLRDLMPNVRYDVPPGPFGGSEGYAFAPDGSEMAYTAKDAGRADAWSTDLNLYVVSTTGGAPRVITAGNPAADQNPVYTPNGEGILYTAQKRAGFESDRWRLMFYDRRTRKSSELLPSWDRNADAYLLAPDVSALYVNTTDAGREKLFRFDFSLATPPRRHVLAVDDHNNASFTLSSDGRTLRGCATRPIVRRKSTRERWHPTAGS